MNVDELERRFSWAYKEHMPVNVFHKDDKCRIIFTSGVARHNWRWLHLLNANDVLLCALPWCWSPRDFMHEREVIDAFQVRLENVHIMSNEEKLIPHIRKCGFKAHFINKNCFLDENIFQIGNEDKIYNAVLNARPEKWKNHHLATAVPDLALIEGYCFDESQRVDLSKIPHKYKNNKRLKPREVSQVLQRSRVGLSLSFVEGQCQSSSEYLLCGLPVVSVRSRGGRDVWYDDYNSAICDPTPEDVWRSTRTLIKRKPDPDIIRNNHINLSHQFRNRLIGVLIDVARQFQCDVDMAALFKEKFRHKMTDNYINMGKAMKALM